jgi:hypothetical protein
MTLRSGSIKSPGMSLHVWSQKNWVHYRAAIAQLEGFKDLLGATRKYDKRTKLTVVGSHESKSVRLPVVMITAPILGLKIWIRDNFENLAVTVKAHREIKCLDASRMFTNSLDPVYFEGFKGAGVPVFERYANNHARFSFHFYENTRGDFKLFLKNLFFAAIH